MSTTELVEVRRHPSNYTWGKIHKFHDIGRYTIVEYKPLDEGDEGKASFSIYVDGVDQRHSCESLEQALILAISRAHIQESSAPHMALAACKLLNLV